MNTSIKKLILLPASAILLTACTKEIPAGTPDGCTAGSDEKGLISVLLGNENDGTKMTFSEEGSNLLSHWSEGDAISLTPDSSGTTLSRIYTLVSGAGESTASFRCDNPVTEKSTIWTAYFPSSVKSEADYRNFKFTGQIQNGDDNTSHLSAYNLAKKSVTYATASSAPETISFSGENFSQSSCMKFVISNLPENVIVDSLIFESYKYVTSYYGATAFKITSAPILSMKMSFSSMTASKSLTAYMMFPSKDTYFNSGEFFKITLKGTDGAIYTTERKFTSFTRLEAGKYHTLKINRLWMKDEGIDGTWGTFQTPSSGDVTYPYCNFIIMGDGYTNEDFEGGESSVFRTHALLAYQSLFRFEPFKSLKDRFGVYYVNAVSAQKINTIGKYYNGAQNVDTHTTFEMQFTPNSTSVSGNDNRVMYYCGKIESLSPSQLSRATVIVIGNKECRAGTTVMYYNPYSSSEFCESHSIAYCALGNPEQFREGEFQELIIHEAGGHGFGKLADEYTTTSYYSDLKAAWTYVAQIQGIGLYLNIDKYTSGTTVDDTRWSSLAGIDEYAPEDIDAYDGAFAVANGFCRSTQSSMMKDDTVDEGYFNAASRRAIYHRTMRLIGKSKTETENGFLTWDTSHLPTEGPYSATKSPLRSEYPNRLPLGKPRLIKFL